MTQLATDFQDHCIFFCQVWIAPQVSRRFARTKENQLYQLSLEDSLCQTAMSPSSCVLSLWCLSTTPALNKSRLPPTRPPSQPPREEAREREKEEDSLLIASPLPPVSPPHQSTKAPMFFPEQQISPPHLPSALPLASPTPPLPAPAPPSINSAPPSQQWPFPDSSDDIECMICDYQGLHDNMLSIASHIVNVHQEFSECAHCSCSLPSGDGVFHTHMELCLPCPGYPTCPFQASQCPSARTLKWPWAPTSGLNNVIYQFRKCFLSVFLMKPEVFPFIQLCV